MRTNAGEVSLMRLHARIEGGDVKAEEIAIGCVLSSVSGLEELKGLQVSVYPGIKKAFDEFIKQARNALDGPSKPLPTVRPKDRRKTS